MATVLIPLPAMTPALFSSALGALSITLPSTPPAYRVGNVSYFPRLAPFLKPIAPAEDVVLLGTPDPVEVISVSPEEQALFAEELNAPFVLATRLNLGRPFFFFDRPSPSDGRQLLMSQVPEPSLWAMLIGGFMIVGAVLRRNRPAGNFAGAEFGPAA
jgi:hypothetical protein